MGISTESEMKDKYDNARGRPVSIAYLYVLTATEFNQILTTFTLGPAGVKNAALAGYPIIGTGDIK